MNSVASYRIYSWAKVWADSGHEVTIITAPKPMGDDGFTPDLKGINIIESSNILLNLLQRLISKKYTSTIPNQFDKKKPKHYTTLLQKLNRWRKARGLLHTHRMPDHLALWKYSALNSIKREYYDVIVSSFGPYVTHLIAEQYKILHPKTKWVSDFRDLWVDHGLLKGLFPFTYFEKKLQKRILRKADIITTVSFPLANVLNGYCVTKKTHIIYNGFFKDTPTSTNDFQPTFSEDKIRLVYTGTIYEGPQNYSPLLEALLVVKNNQSDLINKLEIVIASRQSGNLAIQACKYGLNSLFTFYQNVSHNKSLSLQKNAHVLLFLDYETRILKGVLTGKLFEYMNSGTEIWSIGGDNNCSDANLLIKRSKTGKVFGLDSQTLCQELILLLKSNKKPSFTSDRKVIEEFSRENQALKLLKIIKGAT